MNWANQGQAERIRLQAPRARSALGTVAGPFGCCAQPVAAADCGGASAELT
jgi:hypothetical protein